MKTRNLNHLLLSLTTMGAIAIGPLWAESDWDAVDRDEGVQMEDISPENEGYSETRDATDSDNKHALVDAVRELDGTDRIVSILESVDLDGLIESGESYTFFLPNDDAFEAYENDSGRSLSEANGTTELEALLRAHIATGVHTAADLREEPAQSLAGHQIEGSRDLLIRPVVEPVSENGDSVGERARMVETNIETAAGLVHLIDAVWVEGEASDSAAIPGGEYALVAEIPRSEGNDADGNNNDADSGDNGDDDSGDDEDSEEETQDDEEEDEDRKDKETEVTYG